TMAKIARTWADEMRSLISLLLGVEDQDSAREVIPFKPTWMAGSSAEDRHVHRAAIGFRRFVAGGTDDDDAVGVSLQRADRRQSWVGKGRVAVGHCFDRRRSDESASAHIPIEDDAINPFHRFSLRGRGHTAAPNQFSFAADDRKEVRGGRSGFTF